VRPVGLRGEHREQGAHEHADVAHDSELERGTAPQVRRLAVDLDGGGLLGKPVWVGEVGTEHEKHVRVVEGLVGGGVADEPGLPDLEGVVLLEPFLRSAAASRMTQAKAA